MVLTTFTGVSESLFVKSASTGLTFASVAGAEEGFVSLVASAMLFMPEFSSGAASLFEADGMTAVFLDSSFVTGLTLLSVGVTSVLLSVSVTDMSSLFCFGASADAASVVFVASA